MFACYKLYICRQIKRITMKKFVVLIVVFATFNIMNAQDTKHDGFKKDDMFVSGSVGYSSSSYPDESKENNFNITPRFGYFISDFVAIGGRAGYALQNKKNPNGDKVADNSTFTVSVFGRYYLLPASKFSIFGELGVGFGTTKNIQNDHTTGVNAAFSPGLSYFLGRHFALEASFGVLSYNTVKPDGGSGSTDSFDVGIDLENINFGIIYKF